MNLINSELKVKADLDLEEKVKADLESNSKEKPIKELISEHSKGNDRKRGSRNNRQGS
jgi:hypothetical protein